MMFDFTCPYCGWETEVAQRYAGRVGKCVSCGKPIEIPSDIPQSNVRQTRGNSKWWMAILVLGLVLIGGVAFYAGLGYVALKPTINKTLTQTGATRACHANMKKISTAILAYVADKGHFPPAYTVSKDGRPLHSWRVHILPYLGYKDLYSKIRLDEPWDSPANLSLSPAMPAEYRCPADAQAVRGETNYFVVTGPGMYLFDADRQTTASEIVDGASQTMLVVEGTGMGTDWMQPTDIPSRSLGWSRGARGIGSQHKDGSFLVLTADGVVSALDETTTVQELQALSTMSGGEAVYPALSPP